MIEYKDVSDIIDREIAKRRNKWSLTALNWIDFDGDVSQIIRFHIFKKLHLYDESRPFLPWVNTVISAQIKNIVRNNYSNYTRPCLRCDAAEGDNLCRIFTKQCSQCPLYDHWEKHKKAAYNTKLPVSLNALETMPEGHYSDLDYDKGAKRLHKKMRECLKSNEYLVYKYLYINGLPEEGLAEFMGYKTTEKDRSPGYKILKLIKKKIIALAKEKVKEIDI